MVYAVLNKNVATKRETLTRIMINQRRIFCHLVLTDSIRTLMYWFIILPFSDMIVMVQLVFANPS